MATSDPRTKLNDAADLTFRYDRPYPAQRLIFEAIEIYKADNDPHGLGLAYRSYAELLRSEAIAHGKQSQGFREGNFFDRSITFDNRLDKSNQYYLMAIEQFMNAESGFIAASRYDALTNVYFNVANSFAQLKNVGQACVFYDKSLWAYEENIKQHPEVTPYSPTGTVPERLAALKQQVGCKTPRPQGGQ